MQLATWTQRLALGLVLGGTALAAAPAEAQPVPSADSVAALAARLQPVVEAYRGLHFLRPVPVEIVTDSVARRHFTARMARFYPQDALATEVLAYEHLGLLAPGTDLQDLLLGVLEEQAGGYYDPETDTFYVLGDVPATLLRIVLVHELTHALDDQHFDIDSTFAALARDEDRQAAYDAVVEGSGTRVMTRYVVQAAGAGDLDEKALLDLQASDFGQAARLAAAPAVVRCALLAPYVLGEAFLALGDTAAAAPGESAAAAVDRAFRDPPLSTEQILHPAKYWEAASRDVPRPLPAADFGPVFGGAWRKQGEGVLGEILVALLTGTSGPALDGLAFADPGTWTNAAAAGWGNDRWELWSDGDRHRTVWVSCWDTSEDAWEFVAAVHPPNARVARRGDTVVVIVGDSPGATNKQAQACLDLLVPKPVRR